MVNGKDSFCVFVCVCMCTYTVDPQFWKIRINDIERKLNFPVVNATTSSVMSCINLVGLLETASFGHALHINIVMVKQMVLCQH